MKNLLLIQLLLLSTYSLLSAQNNALHFDGTDYVLTNNALGISGNSSRTIEFWAKNTGVPNGNELFGFGDPVGNNVGESMYMYMTANRE